MVLERFKIEKIELPLEYAKSYHSILGIDMGQSLTKIVFKKKNILNLFTLPTQKNIDDLENYLNYNKDSFSQLNLTGGKCYNFYLTYKDILNVNLINEFVANMKGLEFLYKINKKKRLHDTILVSIGTGTSIVLQGKDPIHLGGSALGGGFFMGIIKLLYDISDYRKSISLSKKGNRYNIDLKVSDIYDPRDVRVDAIFREFTAASLGKILNEQEMISIKKEDVIASIICMIAENIGTLAVQMAQKHNVKELVFFGGFLTGNKILKKVLSLICKINKKKSIFLKNSVHAGAIGALLSI